MIPVNSSNLKAVDYDADGLLVAFRNGSLYRYSGVPHEKFTSLLNASSKGQYLASHIKPYYRYRQVR